MKNPGEKEFAAMPEFAPLLEVIRTPIEADVVAYFQKNPKEELDASLLAGKIRPEDIESVQKALDGLETGRVLSSEVKGVSQTRHYSFFPSPTLRRALDQILGDETTREVWQDFRIYLAEESLRRQRRRKILTLAVAALIAGGLAVGIYFLVQTIKSSSREPVREDLSRFTGVHETWYPNGQIKSRIEYVQGRREGSFAAWFENGQKMAEGAYRDNRPDGRWSYSNEQGEPLAVTVYEDGRAVRQ